MTTPTKQCTECSKTKPITEFRKQSRNKDGLKYYCKECDDKYQKERYLDHKDHILQQCREYRKSKARPPESST